MCACVCILLTCCHCLGAVVVAAVFLQGEVPWHPGGGVRGLGEGGGCWVIGGQAVLRGHVVAQQTVVTVGHLLHTDIETNNFTHFREGIV